MNDPRENGPAEKSDRRTPMARVIDELAAGAVLTCAEAGAAWSGAREDGSTFRVDGRTIRVLRRDFANLLFERSVQTITSAFRILERRSDGADRILEGDAAPATAIDLTALGEASDAFDAEEDAAEEADAIARVRRRIEILAASRLRTTAENEELSARRLELEALEGGAA